MADTKKIAERIAKETGGNPERIQRCLEQSKPEDKPTGLDIVADVISLGATAVLREVNRKK